MENLSKKTVDQARGLKKLDSVLLGGHAEKRAIDLKKDAANKDEWRNLAALYAEGGEDALNGVLFNSTGGKKLTREQLVADPAMQKELKAFFDNNNEGLTFDDFLTTMPAEADYLQHATDTIAAVGESSEQDLNLGQPIEFAKGTNPNIRLSDLTPPRSGRDFSNLPPLPVIGKGESQSKPVARGTEDLRAKLKLKEIVKENFLIRKQKERAEHEEETKKGVAEIATVRSAQVAQNINENDFLRQSADSLKFNQEDRQYLLEKNTEAQKSYIVAYRKFFKLTSRPDLSKPNESDQAILIQPLRIPFLRRFSSEARNLKQLHEKMVKAGEALEAVQ